MSFFTYPIFNFSPFSFRLSCNPIYLFIIVVLYSISWYAHIFTYPNNISHGMFVHFNISQFTYSTIYGPESPLFLSHQFILILISTFIKGYTIYFSLPTLHHMDPFSNPIKPCKVLKQNGFLLKTMSQCVPSWELDDNHPLTTPHHSFRLNSISTAPDVPMYRHPSFLYTQPVS